MVEEGNKQGELKDSRKPGCFDPEEFRAGQSSAGTGGAAGSPEGTGAAPGSPALPAGRDGKMPPVVGMPFFLNGLGIEMQTTDLQKKAEQSSEHTHTHTHAHTHARTHTHTHTHTRAGAVKAAKRPPELWDGGGRPR
ncbi:stress response protein NST1-like [Motacilla alba alba]|uniref:stress response protein NST1-like n=1 Tax=Motacilla alba alba TaxID=1094192 RepID=UPI0018D575F6|nr:stress response protein NST1-like [Motacilla alba alba]